MAGKVKVIQADATALPLEDQSVDLVCGSPPYCDARTYGIGAQRDAREWVEWMLDVTTENLRVSRGPVIWIAAGVTRDRNYWPACEGLMWEWFKRGGHAYRPTYWYRVGIPGSGGDQWFRADVEYAMCFKRPGALPWTDNTALGHPPKWAPGGEMSYRMSNGTRRNHWGRNGTSSSGRTKDGDHRPTTEYELYAAAESPIKRHTKARADGTMEEQFYAPPPLANPGTAIEAIWAEHEETFWLDIPVGGGKLGDKRAHENEAPYPEKLAEWFIRSLCPPGGTVLDPFSGSGTTAKVALSLGRNAIAGDIRESQVELTKRRVAEVQPMMF